MSRTKPLLCLIIALLTLSGCNGDRCIDADDFGFPRFTVSSRYDSNSTPAELFGSDDNEIGIWRDSGYFVNGKPLTIVVKNWRSDRDANSPGELSAWCPWYGNDNNGKTLGDFQKRFPTCNWTNNETCTATLTAQLSNAPCLMKKGIGLYALIAKPNANPNENPDTISGPSPDRFIVFHVGGKRSGYTLYDNVLSPSMKDNNIPYTTGKTSTAGKVEEGVVQDKIKDEIKEKIGALFGEGMVDIGSNVVADAIETFGGGTASPDQPEEAGGIVYKYEGLKDAAEFIGGKLYFKILDSHYDDNGGQYIVIIKSGVESANPDPIDFVTNLIATKLFGAPQHLGSTDTAYGGKSSVVRGIYENVLMKEGYRTSVSAILTIYIILFALSFLIGIVQITHTDLIIRVIKVAIVSVLLNPSYGWSFFYDNLFVFFVEGMHDLLQQIKHASQVGPASGGVFSLLISMQLMKKILALLFTSWHGFIFIILYVIILVFFGLAVIKNLMLYASSLIMIGMIIIMGPIFICFMLFNVTKSLFETWLKQLIFYSMNAIILVAVMSFIGVQIEHTIYANFGFKVCREDFPDLGPKFKMLPTEVGDAAPRSIFSWWFPSPKKEDDFSKTLVLIPVPESHYSNYADPPTSCTLLPSPVVSESKKRFCPAYGCNECRYYNLPFLDPMDKKDLYRIKNFFTGQFTQFFGLLYLIILIYLLNKMNDASVQIAGTLANVSMNQTNIQHAVLEAYTPISQKLESKLKSLNKKYGTGKIDRKIEGLKERFWESKKGQKIDMVLSAAKNFFVAEDGKRTGFSKAWNSWNRDAMASNAYQSVIDKVRLEYGIDRNKLNPNAEETYGNRLAAHGLDSFVNPADLKDALAKKHQNQGKTFDKLSETERKSVLDLMNKPGVDGKSLKDLAIETREVQEFRARYAEVYDNMSAQELGSLTRETEVFRLGSRMAMERMHVSRMEALSKDANQEVIARLKKSGITIPTSSRNAETDYIGFVQKSLMNANPDLKKDYQTLRTLTEHCMSKPEDLKNVLAKQKFGNDIDKLSQEGKKEIQGIVDSGAAITAKLKEVHKFQDAYVKASIELREEKRMKKIGKEVGTKKENKTAIAIVESRSGLRSATEGAAKALQELDLRIAQKTAEAKTRGRIDSSIIDDIRAKDEAQKKYEALDRELRNEYAKVRDGLSAAEASRAAAAKRESDKKWQDRTSRVTRVAGAIGQKVDSLKQKASYATSGNWISDVADAGYGALFKIATGGQDIRDLPDMSKRPSGKANDPRHTTDRERQAEYQRTLVAKNLEDEIKRQRKIQNVDVLHPEFLASIENHPSASKYHELVKNDISHKVDELMKSGKEPAVLGATYTRKHMTDKEFAKSLQKAQELEKRFIDNDPYISQEYKYEDKNDSVSAGAMKVIEERKRLIKEEVKKHTDWLESERDRAQRERR
jgi:type IV secretion system protein VirB6